jgi:hypothetical protein
MLFTSACGAASVSSSSGKVLIESGWLTYQAGCCLCSLRASKSRPSTPATRAWCRSIRRCEELMSAARQAARARSRASTRSNYYLAAAGCLGVAYLSPQLLLAPAQLLLARAASSSRGRCRCERARRRRASTAAARRASVQDARHNKREVKVHTCSSRFNKSEVRGVMCCAARCLTQQLRRLRRRRRRLRRLRREVVLLRCSCEAAAA